MTTKSTTNAKVKIKHYIIRKQKTSIFIINKGGSNSEKKSILNVARKINGEPNNFSSMLGTLEYETEFPENYLKSDHPAICNKSVAKGLVATDIFYRALLQEKRRHQESKMTETRKKEIRKIIMKRCSKVRTVMNIANFSNIKPEIKDENIIKKYKTIKERIYNSMTDSKEYFSMSSIMEMFKDTRQNRVFNNYNETQGTLDKYFKRLKTAIGRDQGESLISTSTTYREKVERNLSSASSASNVFNGSQSWLLNLRNSGNDKNTRHFMYPISSTNTELWMRILDKQDEPNIYIRKPATAINKPVIHFKSPATLFGILPGIYELLVFYHTIIGGWKKCI